MFPLLTPATQRDLAARSKEVNEAAGFAATKASDFLLAQGFSPRHLKSVTRTDDTSREDRAEVEVVSHLGPRYTVPMQRIEGVWRIHLEMPEGSRGGG